MNLSRAASLMECQIKQRVRNHKARKELQKNHVRVVAKLLKQELRRKPERPLPLFDGSI